MCPGPVDHAQYLISADHYKPCPVLLGQKPVPSPKPSPPVSGGVISYVQVFHVAPSSPTVSTSTRHSLLLATSIEIRGVLSFDLVSICAGGFHRYRFSLLVCVHCRKMTTMGGFAAPNKIAGTSQDGVWHIDVSTALLSIIFQRIPSNLCRKLIRNESIEFTHSKTNDEIIQIRAAEKVLAAMRRQDLSGAEIIAREFVEPSAVDRQRSWWQSEQVEESETENKADTSDSAKKNCSTSSDGNAPVSTGSWTDLGRSSQNKSRGKRRVVKYNRTPGPDNSTSENDDSNWGADRSHRLLNGQRQRPATAEPQEWVVLGTVSLPHDTNTRQSNPTGGDNLLSPPASNSRSEKKAPTEQSPNGPPENQAAHSSSNAPVSFWVPLRGSKDVAPNKSNGWNKSETTSRTVGKETYKAECFGSRNSAPKIKTRPGNEDDSGSIDRRVHDRSKQSHPRQVVRPQRVASKWERSLRKPNKLEKGTELDKDDFEASYSLNAHEKNYAGSLNLVWLPEDDNRNLSKSSVGWTEVTSSSWYR